MNNAARNRNMSYTAVNVKYSRGGMPSGVNAFLNILFYIWTCLCYFPIFYLFSLILCILFILFSSQNVELRGVPMEFILLIQEKDDPVEKHLWSLSQKRMSHMQLHKIMSTLGTDTLKVSFMLCFLVHT